MWSWRWKKNIKKLVFIDFILTKWQDKCHKHQLLCHVCWTCKIIVRSDKASLRTFQWFIIEMIIVTLLCEMASATGTFKWQLVLLEYTDLFQLVQLVHIGNYVGSFNWCPDLWPWTFFIWLMPYNIIHSMAVKNYRALFFALSLCPVSLIL